MCTHMQRTEGCAAAPATHTHTQTQISLLSRPLCVSDLASISHFFNARNARRMQGRRCIPSASLHPPLLRLLFSFSSDAFNLRDSQEAHSIICLSLNFLLHPESHFRSRVSPSHCLTLALAQKAWRPFSPEYQIREICISLSYSTSQISLFFLVQRHWETGSHLAHPQAE